MNNPDKIRGSISGLIEDAKQGHEPSLQALFNRFNTLLVQWANRELDSARSRAFDADDIAIEAFHAFCQGIVDDKFPELENRHALRALLATITIRKAINQIDQANAQKRGNGNVRGESIFENARNSGETHERFGSIESSGLSPDEQAILNDQIEYSLSLLPDNLEATARRLLMGLTPREISAECGRSTRAIEIQRKRIFELLRNIPQ